MYYHTSLPVTGFSWLVLLLHSMSTGAATSEHAFGLKHSRWLTYITGSEELSWDCWAVHQHMASLRGSSVSQRGGWVLRGSIPKERSVPFAAYRLSSHSTAWDSRMGQINLDGEWQRICDHNYSTTEGKEVNVNKSTWVQRDTV